MGAGLYLKLREVSLGLGELGEWWTNAHRKGCAASETHHQAQQPSPLSPMSQTSSLQGPRGGLKGIR